MEALILTTVNSHLLPAFDQHGFRPGHSTTSALLQLTSDVTGFNQRKPPNRTIYVAVDLTAAFDTVNHNVLLSKMARSTLSEHCKIRRAQNEALRIITWSHKMSSILYTWKIIEKLAPNFPNQITSTFSGRRGRSCVISHVNVGRVGTLAYNRWRSIRLFISLPMHLRSISSCSVFRFKTQLYIFLRSVEDLPCLPGFNNSLDGGDDRWWSLSDVLATN